MKHIIISELTQERFDDAMKRAVHALNEGDTHLQVSVMYSDDKWFFTATKLCTIRVNTNYANPHVCFNEHALEHHKIDYKQWQTILKQ